MLLPVSNLKIYNSSRYTLPKAKQNKALSIPYDIKSIYNRNINFTHYMGFSTDKETINNPDYYKLPAITLSDGTIHQFTPDRTQIECAKYLSQGNSVVYSAPTGTGKTAVIHFAVNKNLDEDKKTYITVPLIALANDKYREFTKIYGKDNVGIMTGDRKLNPDAPIIIMTTEILYNQAKDLKENSNNIGTIVFDEAHYMSDVERGSVWEKSIMESVPNNIPVLCLSATVGNPAVFNSWIYSLDTQRNSSLVELKPTERYVPLVWQIYKPETSEKFTPIIQYAVDIENLSIENLTDKQKRGIARIFQIQNYKNEFYEPTKKELEHTIEELKSSMRNWYQSTDDFEEDFLDSYGEFEPYEAKEIANLLRNEDDKYVKHIYSKYQPEQDFKTLIDNLNNQDKLPAIIFKLSRGKCDEVCQSLFDSDVNLTTEDEKKEIENIIEKYKQKGYLGKDINEQALMQGFGVHHAGKLPEYRKLIEELFSKKLLKVVISTSTLSAGINMPARSVILSDMQYRKYDPHTKEMKDTALSVNEFHQMAGRAGRRGVDNIGNVILYNLKAIPEKYKNEEHNKGKVDELELAYKYLSAKPDNIRSQFRPDPVIVARYFGAEGEEELFKTINKSFGIYGIAKEEDKDERAKKKLRQFENYAQILLKQGFMYRDYKNQYVLLPKGNLLLNAQGANPLMTANLVYDEILDDISPLNLAQIAGYIAGSDEIEESSKISVEVDEILEREVKEKSEVKDFRKLRQKYQQKEDRLLRSLLEAKIPPYDVISSDNVSGLVTYLWAKMNFDNDNNTIENFEKLTSLEYNKNDKDVSMTMKAKLSEGNIYRIISHSISVLKQIERLCDAALSDSNNFPNQDYYKNLKDCAIWTLDLIDRKPISVEDI